MIDSSLQELFLSLIRLGIGDSSVTRMPKDVNWDILETFAAKQGLSAVIVDGIEKLSEDNRPPKSVLLQWIGETLQGYEHRYELYRRAIAELADFYNSHGHKMMLLKGYACALNWPKPEHRPCGDIDIWQFGKQKEADALLTKEKSIKIDKGHHHHTVFYWSDFMVENHYDFINIYQQKSHKKLEKILKDLGTDDSRYIEVYGVRVYLPSPNLHALFLIKHILLHFVASEMTFRQLLDWALFVKAHTNEIDWVWLNKVLEEFGMKRMFSTINAICVEELGFDSRIFKQVQFEPSLKDKVLKEMFVNNQASDEPRCFFSRAFWRYNRWKKRDWKHELCYQESMWSSFWYGMWAHLLKPRSI